MTETDHTPLMGYYSMSPKEAIELLRHWSKAAKENPPLSGQFLAEDLCVVADVLEATLETYLSG